MNQEDYLVLVARLGHLVESYFREMEDVLENFHLSTMPQSQERVATKFRQPLSQAQEELSQVAPPTGREGFHKGVLEGYAHLNRSCQVFCHPVAPEHYLLCYRGCRQEMSEAMRCLYPLRLQVPGVNTYWVTDDEVGNLARIEKPAEPAPGVPTGLLYRDWDPHPPRYTLYVPENYDPAREWPMIVYLHGGGGNDHDSIWLWLRYAKSKGFLLVAPKSPDFTWVFSDVQWVLASIKEVSGMYRVNQFGIFLTGVSDGGTFSYEFGLTNPQVFAAIAPVAGAFVPWPWYDFAKGNHVPVFILHGTKDRVIPVVFARTAKKVLGDFGYPLVYREIPHWGHAWPFSRIGEIGGFFQEVLRQRQEQAQSSQ